MKIKKFNEAFSRETVFYKIVHHEHLKSILEVGLLPGKAGGTYAIAEENFDDWLIPNKLWGSYLQALLFFTAIKKRKFALLRIKIKPDKVKVRNVGFMLSDMKKWIGSTVDINDLGDTDFEVSEYIIMGTVPPSNIEVVSEFMSDRDMCKFKLDPVSLKNYIFGQSNVLVKVGKLSIPRLVLKYIWLSLKLKYF